MILSVPHFSFRTLALLGLTVFLCACAVKSQAQLLSSSAYAHRLPAKNYASHASVKTVSSAARSSAASSAVPQALTPPQNKHIPILVYHNIRKQEGWAKTTWSWKMTVTPQTFAAQMQWFADHHYTPINLDTFVSIMSGELAGPEKPVVITFDDNDLNAYDNGLSALMQHNFIAVWYIITNRIDNPHTVDRRRILDLVSKGMDIESHTVSHAELSMISLKQLDWELTESKRVLEELTGKPVHHIAYPLVMQNKTVRVRAKAAGYVTGTIMDPRDATEKDDLLKLPRIMMTDDTHLSKVLP